MVVKKKQKKNFTTESVQSQLSNLLAANMYAKFCASSVRNKKNIFLNIFQLYFLNQYEHKYTSGFSF